MSVDDNKGSIRYLFVFYSIPIRPNVKIDRHKGTKKVRETADMVRVVANGEHEEHEDSISIIIR